MHEIENIAAFLTSRVKVKGSCADLAEKLAESMACQIQQLPSFDSAAASRLANAVEHSAYEQAGKVLICDAIDRKLMDKGSCPSHWKAQRNKASPTQYLHSAITCYLTENDWAGLHTAKKTLASKLQIIADRLVRIGLCSPDEYTFAWGLGLVLHCHFPRYPSYAAVHGLLEDLKLQFWSSKQPWGFGYIVRYPNDPRTLPKDVFEHAYDYDDPPPRRRYCIASSQL